MKKCYKCKEEKQLSEFYNNKNKKDGKSCECKLCKGDLDREYNLKNKKQIKVYTHDEKILAIKKAKKKYREANKEKLRIKNKEYRLLNKEKRNKRISEKRKTDSMFKLKGTLRHRIGEAFKKSKWNKNKGSKILLGADFDVVKLHIENQFDTRMSWDNHGPKTWHIDHIIPLASAETEEDLYKLCHYTNLQPLWWSDNLQKSAKVN
jgi:hypothetical protein